MVDHSLLAQTTKYISFEIINSSSGEPISYARILDRTHNRQWVSDEEGKVSISLTDSILLKITALGFNDYYWLCDSEKDQILVSLIPKIYELHEVAIAPYPTIAIFKKAFENLETEDSSFLMNNLWPIYAVNHSSTNMSGYHEQNFISIYLGSPITSLYNMFSKKGKSLQKFKQLTGQDQVNFQISKRYNMEKVRALTGVQETEKLNAIMEYCRPSLDFILSASDYEIAIHIISCYQNFLLENR